MPATPALAPVPLLLLPREAARLLSISERKLWTLTHVDKAIAYVRVGRLVRYSPCDLQSWIDSNRQGGDEIRKKVEAADIRYEVHRALCQGLIGLLAVIFRITRLAILLTLLGGTTKPDAASLLAAVAVWSCSKRSARCILGIGGALDGLAAAAIRAALREKPQAVR